MISGEAVKLLEEMIWRPGTEASYWPVGPHHIGMEVLLRTFDSSPEPDGRLHIADITSPPVKIRVEGLTEEQVLGSALNAMLQIEAHEIREFFRRGNGGPAPFHPHNTDGEEAWQRTRGLQVEVRYPRPH